MNVSTIHRSPSPVILVVQNSPANLAIDSPILGWFNQIYVSVTNYPDVLLWIQQNQPDLIVVDLPWFQIMEVGLIPALRLDWLTRDIPIIVLGDRSINCSDAALNLDYNGCLCKPYSTQELEKLVCSLVSIPACLSYAP